MRELDGLLDAVLEIVALTDCVGESDGLLDTLLLPDSVIVPSLVMLWLTVTLVLGVGDELAVTDCVAETDMLLDTVALPGCVAETDVLLEAAAETLGLPDSVVDASLEMLWLTVTLLVPLASVLTLPDELTVPDCVVLSDELLETSLDTLADVESEELADAVGWRVAVKLDV